MSVSCKGEQLVKMVHRVHANEATNADDNRQCYEADQGYLWKVSFICRLDN